MRLRLGNNRHTVAGKAFNESAGDYFDTLA